MSNDTDQLATTIDTWNHRTEQWDPWPITPDSPDDRPNPRCVHRIVTRHPSTGMVFSVALHGVHGRDCIAVDAPAQREDPSEGCCPCHDCYIDLVDAAAERIDPDDRW